MLQTSSQRRSHGCGDWVRGSTVEQTLRSMCLHRCQECQQGYALEPAAPNGSVNDDVNLLGESWLHLTTSAMAPRDGDGAHARAERGLFQELEERRNVSEICDHDMFDDTYPLCESCAHKVALQLKAAHDDAEREYAMYMRQYEELCEGLQNEEWETEEDKRELLQQAQAEEQALLAKSKALEEEHAVVCSKVRELQEKCHVLQDMHSSYWRDYNDLQLQLRSSDRDSLRRKIEATLAQVYVHACASGMYVHV